MTNKKQIFIIISVVVLILDLVFVAINYYSSKTALHASLLDSAQEKQKNFNHTLSMVYRNMLQMAENYSQLDELNQLFLAGKKAVEAEGGGAGGEQAHKARLELLGKVKPGWDNMTRKFKVRQLHYHLGPGSLSFLRVHKPEKYGDRMDAVRYTIVDTNEEKTSRVGFETGRVYSGLRGVSPVWVIDPDTNKKVYVGAIEVGSSFEQILPIISDNYQIDLAVLLTRQHLEKKMWPEFVQQYFRGNPDVEYYVESSSSPNLNSVLKKIKVRDDFVVDKIKLVKINDRYISTYYFPLRDYRGTKYLQLPAAGFVFLWKDVSGMINEFHSNVVVNLMYALIALVIIELTLYMLFRHEIKLTNSAMYDGLTEVPNRRYFDENFSTEFRRSSRTNRPLSLVVCDIDYFKQFNDVYGHMVGDDCLRRVAETLKNNLKRAGDCVARFGGEEFTILLPDTDLEAAVKIAERLRNEINKLKIPHSGSEISEFLTISMGVSSADLVDGADELLKRADGNLYMAKEMGRNRVCSG